MPKVLWARWEFWMAAGYRPEPLSLDPVGVWGQLVPPWGAVLGTGARSAAPLTSADYMPVTPLPSVTTKGALTLPDPPGGGHVPPSPLRSRQAADRGQREQV